MNILFIFQWKPVLRVFVRPISVAELDACLTDDQEAAGLIPARSGSILSMVILSLPLIQEGQLSVSGKTMCTSTGYPLKGLRLPRKNVVS